MLQECEGVKKWCDKLNVLVNATVCTPLVGNIAIIKTTIFIIWRGKMEFNDCFMYMDGSESLFDAYNIL